MFRKKELEGMSLLKPKHCLMKFLPALLELENIFYFLDHQGLYDFSLFVC